MILLVLLSLHYSQGLEIGYKIEPFEEGPVFDGFKGKSLDGKRQKGTNDMLQFVARGHVLGFRKGDVFIASGDHALRIEFINARPVSPADDGASPDPGNNRHAVKPLGRVSYSDLWDGVTLVYERHGTGVVKSTYTVQPEGTDASSPADRIRLRYNVPVAVDDGGNLVFSFETGQMKESRPVAWQKIKGKRIPVEVSFRLLSEREIGFKVGSYDPEFPLVIDPVLTWHTFMGSTDYDEGSGIAVDTSGNVYVAGYSDASWGTPVNPHAGGDDAFATKIAVTSYYVFDGHDFNGNGSSDVSVFRPSNGTWYLRSIARVGFGAEGDIPINGDYNGDGTTDIAIFRPSTGMWAVKDQFRVYYGQSGNIPVPGDYNGDGTTDIAIFRPSLGMWAIRGQFRTYYGWWGDTVSEIKLKFCSLSGLLGLLPPASLFWSFVEV